MKKLMIATWVLASFAVCMAGTNNQECVKTDDKAMTREQLRDVVRRANLSRTGGYVRKADSAKGWFVVVNAQKTVDQKEIAAALATLDRQVRIQTRSVAGDGVTMDNVRAKIAEADGTLGVAVVNGGAFPALLCAPEEGWAVVNVAKLSADKPDAATLAARVRREVLRGFAHVAGDLGALYGEPLMQPIVRVSDLDAISREEFAAALLNAYPLTLPRHGIEPWYQRTYVKAVEEGWASAPTNKYQQAIWDKVHTLPKNPMKIEFDPKKGR